MNASDKLKLRKAFSTKNDGVSIIVRQSNHGISDVDRFVEKMQTKEDFEKFMEWLLEDATKGKHLWENQNLGCYIDGFYGFLINIDGYYYNQGITVDVSQLSWRMLAELFLAARSL